MKPGEHATHAGPEPEAMDPNCTLDPPFDAGVLVSLRAGGLSAEEAEAARAHLEDCAHCRALLRGLEPLGEEEIERWMELVPAVKERKEGIVRRLALPLVAVAAAAVVAWFFIMPPPPLPPEYIAGPLEGGIAEVKGTGPTKGIPTFHPNSRIRWVLRPKTALKEPPAARAFVLQNGKLRPLPDSALRRVEGGALVLEGRAGDLIRGLAGQCSLILGLASDAKRLEGIEGLDEPPGVRLYREAVRYEPD